MFADALSRPPATATTMKDIAVAQRSDPYLRALRAGKPCPDNLLFKNKALCMYLYLHDKRYYKLVMTTQATSALN